MTAPGVLDGNDVTEKKSSRRTGVERLSLRPLNGFQETTKTSVTKHRATKRCCILRYLCKKPKASSSSPAFPLSRILSRLNAPMQNHWGSRPIVFLPKQEYSHNLHHASLVEFRQSITNVFAKAENSGQ